MLDYFNSEEKNYVLSIFPTAYIKVELAADPYYSDNDLKYYRIMSKTPIGKIEKFDNYLIGHGDTVASAWRSAKQRAIHIIQEMLSE